MKFKRIYIEITNMCNKSCSFCSKSFRKKEEMCIENFNKVIKGVKEHTDYVCLHVKGEPLLHSKFNEIIRICDENNVKVNITTNGSLLPKQAETLSKYSCIRQINISLHSIDDVTEIDNIVNSIKKISGKQKTYFVYRYWLSKDTNNDKEISILSRLLFNYNIEDFLKQDFLQGKKTKINDFTYIDKDEEFVWPDINNNICNKEGFCQGLKTHIGILSNGDVIPCCLDGEGIINLGNIYEKNLSEILNTDRVISMINNFRNNKREEKLCQHCNFKK